MIVFGPSAPSAVAAVAAAAAASAAAAAAAAFATTAITVNTATSIDSLNSPASTATSATTNLTATTTFAVIVVAAAVVVSFAVDAELWLPLLSCLPSFQQARVCVVGTTLRFHHPIIFATSSIHAVAWGVAHVFLTILIKCYFFVHAIHVCFTSRTLSNSRGSVETVSYSTSKLILQ